jgi:uncharacterized protein YbjT (DUF2867 family)
MRTSGDFEELDRRAAANFATSARDAGVARIVYLGGLGSGEDLSGHLASRHEVGRILRGSGISTIELRASIVIGSGSASFETIRALVERLPAIPAPDWVETAAQPIAVEDVIEYLVAAGSLPSPSSAVFEIGGRDRVSYAEVILEYARQRQLRRRVVRLPPITARVSSVFLGVLTPTHARIAAAMMDSLRNETVVHDPIADQAFSIEPRGLAESIRSALEREDRQFAETHWSHALSRVPRSRWGGIPFGRRRVSSRVTCVDRTADNAFMPIQRLGGGTGWYSLNRFWQLRGLLDSLRGGVGLRRGRRDPDELRVGDAVDFWRVEQFDPGRRLLLAAETKLPGRLWLEFEVEPTGHGSQIRQTTVFDPAGYVGLAYWYLLYPVHANIFQAMLRGLRRATLAEPEVSV